MLVYLYEKVSFQTLSLSGTVFSDWIRKGRKGVLPVLPLWICLDRQEYSQKNKSDTKVPKTDQVWQDTS